MGVVVTYGAMFVDQVAERVADERAEKCGGGSVGYQIRLES